MIHFLLVVVVVLVLLLRGHQHSGSFTRSSWSPMLCIVHLWLLPWLTRHDACCTRDYYLPV